MEVDEVGPAEFTEITPTVAGLAEMGMEASRSSSPVLFGVGLLFPGAER